MDEVAARDGHPPQGLSIIVLTRGPSFALARLLRSLRRAEGVDQAELLIGLNGAGGEASAVERLVARYLPQTRSRLISVPKTSPAHARNLLIEEATEPLLLFLDDDVEIRGDLLSEAASTMTDDALVAAGGPNLTPPRSPKFEQLAGRVLGSVIGTGPVRHRYRLGERGPATERSLMLSNLVVRRSALSDERFDPDLFCAEENDLLARLAQAGAWLGYNPKLSVHHHRRGNVRGHLRQMAKYGFGRGQMLVRAPSLAQAPYVVPALAIILLAATLAFGPRLLDAVVLLAYLAVMGAGALTMSRFQEAPTVFVLLLATHAGYAVGILGGVLYELFRSPVVVFRRLRRGSERAPLPQEVSPSEAEP